jgi:hypothetical protein
MLIAELGSVYSAWSANRLGGLATEPIHFVKAIGSSPLEWLRESSRLVLRPDPSPCCGILGTVDRGSAELFELAVKEMSEAVSRTQYVGYSRSIRLAKRLAARIEDRLGTEVDRASAVAVPRGGFFVLGYLSHFIPLSVTSDHTGPTLLVDDVSLSGRRMSEWIDRLPDREVVVATLFSSTQVRESVARSYGDRVSWVSAEDVKTYGNTEPHPDETNPPPWRGVTEHICFPWTEPDRGIRLHGTSEFFTGFRLIPPELCLKNQVQSDRNRNRVKIVGNESGWIRTAGGVLWADIGEAVHLADTERGRSQTLDGTAAQFWIASFLFETRAEVTAHLSARYGIDEGRIFNDLDVFIGKMIDEGILLYSDSGLAA